MNGILDTLGVELFPGHTEMHVDTREYLGVGRGALGVDLGHAVTDVLTALFQDMHHVKGGTPAHTDQHQFHRSTTPILPAVFRRPVHCDLVSAVGRALETDFTDPLDSGFHNAPR